MTECLTTADVLAIHKRLIERDGGGHGLRDAGLLEAALLRPQSGYYGDLVAEAAALWESLSQNHPFVDGNKRTAFAARFTFLSANGLTITADPLLAYADIMRLMEPESFGSRRSNCGYASIRGQTRGATYPVT